MQEINVRFIFKAQADFGENSKNFVFAVEKTGQYQDRKKYKLLC
jgi:hypothetical protein